MTEADLVVVHLLANYKCNLVAQYGAMSYRGIQRAIYHSLVPWAASLRILQRFYPLDILRKRKQDNTLTIDTHSVYSVAAI